MEKLLKNKKLLGVIIAVLVLAIAGIAGSGSEDTDTPTTTGNAVVESVSENDVSNVVNNNQNNGIGNNTEKQTENVAGNGISYIGCTVDSYGARGHLGYGYHICELLRCNPCVAYHHLILDKR